MRVRDSILCVTLNTWKNEGDHPARLRAIAAGLAALEPDVVLLQEVFRTCDGATDTGRELAAALGLTLVYAPARRKLRAWQGRQQMSESGLAVLVRGDCVHSETLVLPTTPAGGERIALLVSARLKGQTVMIGCVHLAHLRQEAAIRREQIERILAHPHWRAPAALRLVGGDFNATLASPELAWLGEHHELTIQPLTPAGSTHPNPAPADGRGRAIDLIFAVAPRESVLPVPLDHGVALDLPHGDVWPSDHAAAWVRVRPAVRFVCVHSLTGLGVVGLKPFFARLGDAVLPVPSLLLSGPGNMAGCRRVPVDLEAMMDGVLAALGTRGERAVLFVGYLAGAEQVSVIERILDRHAAAVAELVVDPVCGDRGRAYVSAELVAAWPRLLARADWALPNVTEVELLGAGRGLAALREWTRHGVVVTGAFEHGVVTTRISPRGGEAFAHAQRAVPGHFNGTGDLFAAEWLRQRWVEGVTDADATRLAADHVAAVLRPWAEALPENAAATYLCEDVIAP